MKITSYSMMALTAVVAGFATVNDLKAVSGPGTLVGLDLAYQRNGYFSTTNNSTTNEGPSNWFMFAPAFQMRIKNNWAGEVAVGAAMYKDRFNYSNGYNEEKETYYGPRLSIIRYCDDPCDDDWYPFAGISFSYYAGKREYSSHNNNTNVTTSIDGKVNTVGAGFFGGSYYALGHSFGLIGRVQVLNYNTFRTYQDKSDMKDYSTVKQFNFFNGGSLGVYFKVGS